MTHGVCIQSLVPMRSESSHRSEMVSQLLFGDLFEITERHNEWIRIRCDYDNYTGWVLQAQCHITEIFEFEKLKRDSYNVCYDLVGIIEADQPFPIVLGSYLPFLNKETFNIGNRMYAYKGAMRNTDKCIRTPAKLLEDAYMYYNAPYLWGGRSPFGIDCSGLTQMVYKLSGIKIQRDAALQVEEGRQVHLLEECVQGDLAFFENEEGAITHTGLLINSSKIIHASGRVRIDKIDHYGIFNEAQKKYTHKLRIIKRIL